jgi:hypothetical protein
MFTYKIAQSEKDANEVLDLIQASYSATYEGSDYRESINDIFFQDIEVTSIMLFYQDQLVGTVSLMNNTKGTILPSEFLLGFQRPSSLPSQVCEVGRLAKVTGISLPKEVENQIFMALLNLTGCLLIEQGWQGYICTVQPYLWRKFIQIGFEPTVLEGVQKEQVSEAFGAYANGQIKFLYCESKTSFKALQNLGLDALVETPIKDFTTPSLLKVA